GQLAADGSGDLIVVDTPPSRSALDFLDAPPRLSTVLDGRLIRLLTAPAKASGRLGARVVGAGVGIFSRVLTKIIGAQVLKDISSFVAALETMFGGFRERAQSTYDLLRKPGTAFVVLAAPEPDALREASYFVDRLTSESMPLAGLVLNRAHASLAGSLSAGRADAAADSLDPDDPAHVLAAGALRIHAERARLADNERRLIGRFTRAHPRVPVARIPALAVDVHDLAGLRTVGEALAG
ncbi:MAG TPA: ArsA family ATPase, partial [Mycobacteriales bacterium]|nr:ArsA family ATPase [Mycobacteriales bacterium]